MTARRLPTVVEWEERFSVELPDIDRQHQALFAIINDLWRAIIERKAAGAVTEVMTRLQEYTLTHFADEAALMRSFGYPKLDSHCMAHELFIQTVAKAKHRHLEGKTIELSVLNFLTNWLVDHILTQDKDYANFRALRGRPRSWLTRWMSSIH